MVYSLFIGRYQPLHAGHIKLIRTVLNEGRSVLIALRDTLIDNNNPFTSAARIDMFKKEFTAEIQDGKMKIIIIPDITEICYGRKVGWGIREIKLDKETEGISATTIRSENKKNKK